ncbi:hypothetical protein DB346_13640 [Verrucomicrobia bacterium LW23]|nr:hypothetical protein DB346_13640 [Verrucomicrobia bacterium LW23]
MEQLTVVVAVAGSRTFCMSSVSVGWRQPFGEQGTLGLLLKVGGTYVAQGVIRIAFDCVLLTSKHNVKARALAMCVVFM